MKQINFRKNYFIRILTLGLGIAISVILLSKIFFEISYNDYITDKKHTYIVNENYSEHEGSFSSRPSVSGLIAPGIQKYVPGVVSNTRFTEIGWGSNLIIDENGYKYAGKTALVDTNFFKVFPLKIITGDPIQILDQKYYGLVSSSVAKKMGGRDQVLGHMFKRDDNKNMSFVINGIFEDFPQNSDFKYDILLSINSFSAGGLNRWMGTDRFISFVKFADGINSYSPEVKKALRKMQEEKQDIEKIEASGWQIYYNFEPVSTIHLNSGKTKNILLILAIVSVFLLLASIFNYILIVISSIVKRSMEVGIRKFYGAKGCDIFKLMLKETGVDFIFSILIASLLILYLSGTTLNLVGQSMTDMLTQPTLIKLVGIIFVLYLIASVIPSYLFSKIPLSTVFRKFKESKNRWKKALLFLQFFITAVLLFFLIIVVRQYNTIIHNDPGYAYTNLAHCNISDVDNNQLQTCINSLKSESFIDQVGASYALPYEGYSGNNVYLNKAKNADLLLSYDDLFNIADGYSATENFYEIFEIPFVEGRGPQTKDEIAVSELFVKRINEFIDWPDGVIGKHIGVSEHGQPFTICGIFKDYVVGNSAFPDQRPIVHFWSALNSSSESNLLIKFKTMNAENITKAEQLLKDHLKEKSIEIKIASDDIKAQMSDFIKLRQAIFIGGIFSLLITLMGLIGYTEDETARRSAEIAIRKINGAKIYQILAILIKDILTVAYISILLAAVLSTLAARNLLNLFAVKTKLSPAIFILGGLALLFIIIVVVIIKSIHVAHQNPVKAIKSE